MRIADRHIEWDARSVLTWQYDKAVNMIAFLSVWQKWIDINCSQLFYGCESRVITRENCTANGYKTLGNKFFLDDAHDVVRDYKEVDAIKSFLIPFSQGWKDGDFKREQADAKNGTTSIRDEGRDMVNHIGDTFKMRVRKMYKYSVSADGSLVKEWVNCWDDTSYEVREQTDDFTPDSVTKEVACGSTANFTDDATGNRYWYESEYEYKYVTWNGEQWVECPEYNHEYSGGWFADIFAIDTCNEFGLLLWAKLIGVELPTIYGTEGTKTCAETDEQNEIWRTYIKARFYRLLTNASMHDIIEYLHHVFAQFDNHEILVEDGGSYELGTVNGDTFTEAVNTETDASGDTRTGPVVSIVTVNPNDAEHKGWSITDTSLDTFRNSDTIIREGYKVEVSSPDAASDWKAKTVSEAGADCLTASHAEHGVKTTLNKVKVRVPGDWTEGCEIVSVSGDSMTVRDSEGNEKTTMNDVSVYDSTLKDWKEGYKVIAVNGDGTVKVTMPDGGEADVEQTDVKVRFLGDWEEGYTVDEVLSATRIAVVDSDGNRVETENSLYLYNTATGEYDDGYKAESVDHNGFVVADTNGTKSYAESKYVRMVPYKDIEYFGVKLMTISYSCEFDQNTIERAILNISDFLPHPSAVLSENTMFAGEDIAFGFNSHNFLVSCLPTVVKDADGNKFYVYPYQDLEENDCDIPKKLRKIRERDANKTYIEEKYGKEGEKGLLETLRDDGTIGRWDDIFVCFEVGANGRKGKAWWAVGTEWDCHVEDSEETEVDPANAFTGQTTLYKYGEDGKVVVGTEKTPVIYDEYLGEEKTLRLNGYIRKVSEVNGKWCYYDGRYDPTNVVSSKWKPLTEDRDETTGNLLGLYYTYKTNPTDDEESGKYYVEFDEDGEPKYVNKELRCYANHEEAQNAVCRIESYDADNGDFTPLSISSNQNIANTQTVSFGGEFMMRGLLFRTLFLDRMEWKEFNLFGRKEIDPKNGGYFKGGMESTPVGLTEIAMVVMGYAGDNLPRKFELWHKNYIQRQGVMMESVPSMKPFPEGRKDEDRYYHRSEFDKNGKFVYVDPNNLKPDDRLTTTGYKGLKIKYTRPLRDRRTAADPKWLVGPGHAVDELFKLEDGKDYALAPQNGTYIVDFVYENETIGGVVERVFKGVRFLKKLKKGETDEDATLPWDKRLEKYEDLVDSDVSDENHKMPSGSHVSATNMVMMPTCDYGFVKFNFRNVATEETVEHPYHLHYYGFGKKKDGTNTFGNTPIPYKEDDTTYEPFMSEIALVEIWGQNMLEPLNYGGLSSM